MSLDTMLNFDDKIIETLIKDFKGSDKDPYRSIIDKVNNNEIDLKNKNILISIFIRIYDTIQKGTYTTEKFHELITTISNKEPKVLNSENITSSPLLLLMLTTKENSKAYDAIEVLLDNDVNTTIKESGKLIILEMALSMNDNKLFGMLLNKAKEKLTEEESAYYINKYIDKTINEDEDE